MFPDLVYLLDLCILAYQLHSQTLIWPLDPYAEQMQVRGAGGTAGKRRKYFLREVAEFFRQNNPSSYRGPGFLPGPNNDGWYENVQLDPLIQDYTRISPYRPGLVRPTRDDDGWIVYCAPQNITDRIAEVHVASYQATRGPRHPKGPLVDVKDVKTLKQLSPPVRNPPVNATDLLYCFEGGTGAVKEDDDAAWSLMGFVLAREDDRATSSPKPYDLYIAFRGSRSGTLRPKSSLSRRGNPDWATDLAMKYERIDEVSPVNFHRGFGRSVSSMMPTIMKCCEELSSSNKKNMPPRAIYVTGHSLGGALASSFASAVMLGNTYGPNGAGQKIPQALQSWPWTGMRVVTFAAPPVGGDTFATAFNMAVPGRNVRLPTDIVPLGRGTSIGADVSLYSQAGPGAAHEPAVIRERLAASLKNYMGRNPDTETPWKVFNGVVDSLNYLKNSDLAQRSLTALIPPTFKNGLCDYMEVFKGIIGKEGIPHGDSVAINNDQTAIDTFLTGLKNASATWNSIKALYVPLVGINAIQKDPVFRKFLRVWLVLVAVELQLVTWPLSQADQTWLSQEN